MEQTKPSVKKTMGIIAGAVGLGILVVGLFTKSSEASILGGVAIGYSLTLFGLKNHSGKIAGLYGGKDGT
jgi:uncharacterized membrane protein (UPF0136 family)